MIFAVQRTKRFFYKHWREIHTILHHPVLFAISGVYVAHYVNLHVWAGKIWNVIRNTAITKGYNTLCSN